MNFNYAAAPTGLQSIAYPSFSGITAACPGGPGCFTTGWNSTVTWTGSMTNGATAITGQAVVSTTANLTGNSGEVGGLYGGVLNQKSGADPYGVLGVLYNDTNASPSAGGQAVWALVRGDLANTGVKGFRSSSEVASGQHPESGLLVEDSRNLSASVSAGGAGYTNGTQTLTVSGGTCTTQPQFTVTVAGNAVTAVTGVANPNTWNCTILPAAPAATTGGGGAGATLTLALNEFEHGVMVISAQTSGFTVGTEEGSCGANGCTTPTHPFSFYATPGNLTWFTDNSGGTHGGAYFSTVAIDTSGFQVSDGTVTGAIVPSSNNTHSLMIGTTTNHPLLFETNGSVRTQLTTAGLWIWASYGAGTLVSDGSGNITSSATIYGGAAASSSLTIESTSGAGTTDNIFFKTASQTQRGNINTTGQWAIGCTNANTNIHALWLNPHANCASTDSGASGGVDVVMSGGDAENVSLEMDAYGGGPIILSRRADGTAASRTGVQSGDALFAINTRGWTSSAAFTTNAASFQMLATEAFTNTANGTKFVLRTVKNTTNTLADAMQLDGVGHLQVGSIAPASVATCGTGSIAANSTDSAGTATATGATACTVNFGNSYASAPTCVATDNTTANGLKVTTATGSFTVTGLTSGDTFSWVCVAKVGL